MINDTNVLITFIAATVVLGLFVIFFISFFIAFQKRQIQNIQEKANLKAQFEQEILTSENEIKEEAMRYISRELHDNVVQMLSLVKIQLNGVLADDPNNQAATQSKEYLTGAITDLRALSKTLNTDNILHEGLANTIRFELQRIEKISTIQTKFNENTTKNWLDRKQEIVVFRIFQELMQNIVKHAQAKNITVFLEDNVDFFKLEVQDDGIGFDFEEKLKNRGFDSGSGLANMVYRASLLKGSFKVLKVDSGGSLSTLLIPLNLHNDQYRPH